MNKKIDVGDLTNSPEKAIDRIHVLLVEPVDERREALSTCLLKDDGIQIVGAGSDFLLRADNLPGNFRRKES